MLDLVGVIVLAVVAWRVFALFSRRWTAEPIPDVPAAEWFPPNTFSGGSGPYGSDAGEQRTAGVQQDAHHRRSKWDT